MKYVFKQIESYTPAETTVEFEADSLGTILQQFEFFLKGSGFHFDGTIDIVPTDETDDDVFYNGDDIYEETDTTVMTHVAAELLRQIENRELKKERCDVCKLPKDLMNEHTCFDTQCPLKTK